MGCCCLTWMAALCVPDIIAWSSLGLMPYTYQTGAQPSAAVAVSVCSNAAMGRQAYKVLEGLRLRYPGPWRSSTLNCLGVKCLPGSLSSQYVNEFTSLLSDFLNSKICSNN